MKERIKLYSLLVYIQNKRQENKIANLQQTNLDEGFRLNLDNQK